MPNTFGSNTFGANTFASNTWAGEGGAPQPVPIFGPPCLEAAEVFTPGLMFAEVYTPGLIMATMESCGHAPDVPLSWMTMTVMQGYEATLEQGMVAIL